MDRGESSQAPPEAIKPAGIGAHARGTTSPSGAFERISIESEEGRASTSSREEIAAKLPARVHEYRLKEPCCPFLHGSTFGKRLLYVGDTCCVHEAFMACYFAESVTMVVEEERGEGSENVVQEFQRLIPSWCAGLGMTTPNMSLTMGSAASLGAAPYSKEGGHDKHSGMQQACSMGVDAPVGTSGPTLALATSEATQAAGARTDAAAGPQPALAFSSVDIVIGCNVLKRRSLQDADKVLASMYKLLAPGGEFSCSEILSDRRLGACADDAVLVANGLACTCYVGDFRRIAQQSGFNEPRLLSIQPYVPQDEEAQVALGNVKLFRATLRMFKLPLLEPSCEDYGQVAIYRGSIPECEHEYQLDVHHVFVANQPKLVCGNTATMLEEGWLAPHFHVQGDRSVHYGLFSGSSMFDVSEAKDKCCG